MDKPGTATHEGKESYRLGVADWGQRAKDRDRDNAIKVIEAAAARGQIVEVDKLKRIQDVKTAGTVGEIDLITRGLAMAAPAAVVPPTPPPLSTPVPPTPMPQPTPPTNPTFEPYSPPQTPPVTEPDPSYAPPPNVQYGEPLTPSAGTPISYGTTSTKSGHGGKLVLLFVLIIFVGIAIPIFFGIKAVVDTASDTIDTLTPGKADVISEEGIADLTAAIKEETGSSKVFTVVLYPEYAVVNAPVDSNSKRYVSYYWDGNLRESSKGSNVYDGRFDMTDIEADVVIKLLGDARKLVEGATSNYVLVSPPGPDGAAISAYASNDFNESGYISANFDGKVVNKVKPS